jgi:hypothetical protein
MSGAIKAAVRAMASCHTGDMLVVVVVVAAEMDEAASAVEMDEAASRRP